jgi:hypothetical protein
MVHFKVITAINHPDDFEASKANSTGKIGTGIITGQMGYIANSVGK